MSALSENLDNEEGNGDDEKDDDKNEGDKLLSKLKTNLQR